METVSLRAWQRPRGTKGQLKRLRKQGFLPGVLYGKEIGNLPIQVSLREFTPLLTHRALGSTLINLELADGAGGSHLVVVRELQRDPLRQVPIHVDFFRVSLTEEIETEVPVHLVGQAPGVKEGGVLQHMLRSVTISCLPTQLPEWIEADISHLGIGDELKVGDLQPPPGVKILDDPDSIVVLVVPPVLEGVEAEEEEAGGEAPASTSE